MKLNQLKELLAVYHKEKGLHRNYAPNPAIVLLQDYLNVIVAYSGNQEAEVDYHIFSNYAGGKDSGLRFDEPYLLKKQEQSPSARLFLQWKKQDENTSEKNKKRSVDVAALEIITTPLPKKQRTDSNSPSSPFPILNSEHHVLAQFTPAQISFQGHLERYIHEAGMNAYAIERNPDIVKEGNEEIDTVKEMSIRLGLLPGVGHYFVGAALVLEQVGKIIFTAQNKNSLIKAAHKVYQEMPNANHIYKISRTVAIVTSMIYAQQINRLCLTDKAGVLGFANYIGREMIEYLGKGAENQSTFLNKLADGAYGMLQSVLPGVPKIEEKEERTTVLRFIDALMRHKPDRKSDLALVLSQGGSDNTERWYAGEVLVYSGIQAYSSVLLENQKFAVKNQKQKYGDRYLPLDFVKGYEHILDGKKLLTSPDNKTTSCVIQ